MSHHIADAVKALRAWLKSPAATSRKRRAAKVRKALHTLPNVKPPKPVPAPEPIANTAQRVISAVKSQVGYHEGRSGGHWDNVEKYAALVGQAWVSLQHLPWCDIFACWGFQVGGLKPNVDYPVSAACNTSAAWYKAHGRWSDYPGIGAQIFYGTPGDLVHTGVVTGYSESEVFSVEGNTNTDGSPEGDGVYAKTHERSSSYVVGYGYPKYPEGIVSADPKWRGRK